MVDLLQLLVDIAQIFTVGDDQDWRGRRILDPQVFRSGQEDLAARRLAVGGNL